MSGKKRERVKAIVLQGFEDGFQGGDGYVLVHSFSYIATCESPIGIGYFADWGGICTFR